MLSAGTDPRFHLNASVVGQGIAADVKEMHSVDISEKPTFPTKCCDANSVARLDVPS